MKELTELRFLDRFLYLPYICHGSVPLSLSGKGGLNCDFIGVCEVILQALFFVSELIKFTKNYPLLDFT
jgi:hypothetical protein